MAFFEHTYHVGLRDIGKSNEMTDKAILGYFEEIGGLHSDVVGYGLKQIEQTHLSWVLLHWKIQVLKRPHYGEAIKISTWSRAAFKFYCYRDFEMYDTAGNLLVVATSKWVLVHTEKGLQKLTEEIVAPYESEAKSVFPEVETAKLKEPADFSSTYQYKVLRSNIDVNRHMHNLCYLDVALETLPTEIYEKNSDFSHIEIMYKSESKLGDTLSCFYTYMPEEASHYVTIKSEDEKLLHAIIKLS